MIRPIKSKDKLKFLHYCQKKDEYDDFYIIKDNVRFLLNNFKNAKLCFNEAVKRGNKIFISEENNEIIGVILVFNYKDTFSKQYLHILSDNDKITKNLLKYLFWNLDLDLYIKVKSNNPLTKILNRNYFEKISNENNEELYLHKKFIKRVQKYGYSNNK